MIRKPIEAGSFLKARLLILITYLSAESIYRKHKTYATQRLSRDNFSEFFLKTNMEEELVTKIGNEFQVVGPR